jgi:hypothetical protein
LFTASNSPQALGDARAVSLLALATPDDMRANAEHITLADQFVEVIGPRCVSAVQKSPIPCPFLDFSSAKLTHTSQNEGLQACGRTSPSQNTPPA